MSAYTLSDEQQRALDLIHDGQNTLITGPGGTGKSFLLERIVEDLETLDRKFGVTGSTGVAAVNVGGVTLHSWAGIGIGDSPPSALVSNIRNNVPAFNRIKTTEILLIDEISMISGELLHKLDIVFKTIRENPDVPFGGIQMIFVGDFLQLPPVEGNFAFRATCWKNAKINIITLTRVFRQEDAVFAHALSQIRKGVIDDATRATINSRANAVDPNPEILPVAITSHNDIADRINAQWLSKLDTPARTYKAKDTGSPSGLKLLEKSLIPTELTIKVGARVMCLVNLSPADGIMNGSCGTITAIPKYDTLSDDPTVRFDNGVSMSIERVDKQVMLNSEPIGTRNQFPLRLAWACSSHKAQGSTLDKIELHMAKAFEAGQTYVALSRVRTLDGLFIKTINAANIKADPAALAFYGLNK